MMNLIEGDDGAVLVVAAHADDEVLGCGGTIARLTAIGRRVHIMFMTDGISARQEGDSEARMQAAKEAAATLGAESPRFGDFPDNAMDSIPLLDVARAVESVVSEIKPSLVLTHHHGDLNVDHEIVNRAVLTACRPQPDFCVRTLLAFSVRSSTEWGVPKQGNRFTPNVFIDIEHQIEAKTKALLAYEMELREFPHTRSLEAVQNEASVLGASVGLRAAEALELIRTTA